MTETTDKPHRGRIKNWIKVPQNSDHYMIYGDFLDHPWLREGHTSHVLSHDTETGEIETRNSRYTLVTEGEPSRLKDFPNKGDKYIFVNRNGYDYEREAARAVFVEGQHYEVESCDIGGWHHTVKFVGIEGNWNGVMFEHVAEDPPA